MKTYIIYLTNAILLFFAPIQGLLIAVGVSILLDTIFGIFRAVRVSGWEFITSRRLSQIVSKMLLYQSCILLLYIIDIYVLSEFFNKLISIDLFATKICAILLIFIEGVSIKENFEKATGLDIWALLKKAIGRANELKEAIKK